MPEEFKLPTEPAVPDEKDPLVRALLYGVPKIGKSSLLAYSTPPPLFLLTEPRRLDDLKNEVTIFEQPVNSWIDFKKSVRALALEDHQFTRVAIDTLDNLAMHCIEYVFEKERKLTENKRNPAVIRHETDIDAAMGGSGWGKGYGLVKAEFRSVFNRLQQLHLGIICLSHSKTVPEKTGTGTRDKITH